MPFATCCGIAGSWNAGRARPPSKPWWVIDPRYILKPMPIIKTGDFDDQRVKALLTRHLEGMHANSPPGQVFALDWSGLQKPEISFYALWEGEDLLGFGALKDLESRAGEIKTMRNDDARLRKRVASAILDHLSS